MPYAWATVALWWVGLELRNISVYIKMPVPEEYLAGLSLDATAIIGGGMPLRMSST
jgi:hypothetical protein